MIVLVLTIVDLFSQKKKKTIVDLKLCTPSASKYKMHYILIWREYFMSNARAGFYEDYRRISWKLKIS